MPRALLSVSDKTGIVDLGRGLAARGFELVSTGGTARTMTAAGLQVTGVSEITGFPEMMNGRVKTLHPNLHGGILARRDRPDDLASLDRLGIGLVDLVVVNLYPFAQAAAKTDTPFAALVEEIDIGGPSLVRAAAKNFRDVLVVVDPADYADVLRAIDEGPTLEFRFALMRKAFAHTAQYDTTIAATLASMDAKSGAVERLAGSAAAARCIDIRKIGDLRYGENPHQEAALYALDGARPLDALRVVPSIVEGRGFGRATILQGRALSFTNLLDLDAALRIALEFDEAAAVVVKHTNPCGAATGDSSCDAYIRARDADRLAAFGGIVALNRPIDVAAAQAIVSTFIEAVIAPAVDAEAREILGNKTNMRVLTVDFASLAEGGVEYRSILGAVLAQERDRVVEARQAWTSGSLPDGMRVATRRPPSVDEWAALRFAWRICAHVKSNAVIFTDARRTLAVGAGQMSRVDAVNVAVMKAQAANEVLTGSVAASDAFFPFRDGLDAVAKAGATAVAQPGGSVRDAEVVAAADDHGLAMVFTGRRHFRH
jgi:phosphoribosylaminoimidazolecarboxamide formyltransferase / IMP cyclohydrolase